MAVGDQKFFCGGHQRKDARICSVLRPNAPLECLSAPPQVSTIPVVFTGVSGSSQALLVAATPRDLDRYRARYTKFVLV
jgi:hypothetical protein